MCPRCRIDQRFAVWLDPVRKTPPQSLYSVAVYV